jgi:CRP-like cAMP-binding protein
MLTLLADNSHLVPGLFQMFCRDSPTGRVIMKGNQSLSSALPADGSFSPIEKGLAFKAMPVFSQVSLDDFIALTAVAVEIPMSAGMDFISEGDSSAIYALVSGEVSIEGNVGSLLIAEPSDVIGIYETLSGIKFEFKARVKRDGIALCISHEDLFEIFAQRPALLRQFFSALFKNHSVAPEMN